MVEYAAVLHRKFADVLHRSCVPVTAWEEKSDRDGRREEQVKVSFESLHETEARTIVLPPFVSSYVDERTAQHLIESRQQSLAKALPPKATAAYVSQGIQELSQRMFNAREAFKDVVQYEIFQRDTLLRH